MTEPIAMTIRHMKIEDYPLVYELWIRCTGFTMRDIDDCKDAIKTFFSCIYSCLHMQLILASND